MRKLLNNHISENGFTLLELLVVLAIIGTLSVFGTPLFQDWSTKRSFDAAINEIYSSLTDARLDAFNRGVSTRVQTTKNGDEYTVTTYYLDSSLESCDTGLNWTESDQRSVDLNSNFTITGSGIGNICFYRDGSSTGGSFSIDQKDGGTELGAADISVTLATGFIDVIK